MQSILARNALRDPEGFSVIAGRRASTVCKASPYCVVAVGGYREVDGIGGSMRINLKQGTVSRADFDAT